MEGEVIMNIRQLIAQAKTHLDSDPHLANFILLFTEEVKAAGLDPLAWTIHECSPSKNDVIHLIELLERHLDGQYRTVKVSDLDKAQSLMKELEELLLKL